MILSRYHFQVIVTHGDIPVSNRRDRSPSLPHRERLGTVGDRSVTLLDYG
jgi:hypothetical protein